MNKFITPNLFEQYSNDDSKQRIEHLRNEINKHNHSYYVLNSPTISDKEFDFLLKELEQLELENPQYADPNSPTQRVGSDITKGFSQVTHKRPMISLSNSYSIDDVKAWFDRLKNNLENQQFSIVGELKFDGTSISLTYENGVLVRAVTRGDGEKGDDVTINIKTIKSIPLTLLPGDYPKEFEIRGEILMPWASFDKLNKERAENEEPLFANPRNAASGTLKLQDPKEVAKRNLDIRFYAIYSDELPYDNHFDNLQEAARWGLKVSKEMTLLKSIDEVISFINKWDDQRKTLPVATDGLVFKVNSLQQQFNLGSTAKSPRWAIAYKFNPENACTRLINISYETGRMGIITPVANLEPVMLSGTIVKRASLHNEDIMNQLNIHENDFVYVEKGGEIIPKITGVEISKRQPNATKIKFVESCPVCNTKLVRIEGEAAWICPNKYGCRPQITGKIQHFVARKMMNIDGIGEETAELLFQHKLVTSIADIYTLTVEKLSGLERIGEKTAIKICQGVEESKTVPFERVLFALSIPNVGETTAKRLAIAVKSMDNLRNMTLEQLTDITDIGPIIAKSIIEFLEEPLNIANIQALEDAGVQMKISEDKFSNKSEILKDKIIVISGSFSHHSRDEYKNIIEENGGKNATSISKKTSYVLAGENMGPSKYEKCKLLGVKIIGEEEFIKLLKTEQNIAD